MQQLKNNFLPEVEVKETVIILIVNVAEIISEISFIELVVLNQ